MWVDALTNYITAVGYPDTDSAKFRRYWPADLHVIGKDIVRFHAVYWPAFLMSAGVEVPRRIFSHGFLFNRGEKMSKSVGNVIDPFALIDAYGVDQLRYFFLREVPFGQDGNYSLEAIVNRINADLANDLGNLAQRSLSMVARQLGGVLPKPAAFSAADTTILTLADGMIAKARDAMKTQQLHQVLGIGVGGGCRDEPLFRRGGALGARQERSAASGDRALRHRGGAPAGGYPGPAVHAGLGGQTARSARHSTWRTAVQRARRGTPDRRRQRAAATHTDLSPLRGQRSKRTNLMLIDSHCHLDFPDFAGELDALIARARASDVARMVTISTRVKRHGEVLAIAERFPDVYCSVGTHPHHAHEELDVSVDDLIERTRHPKVVAIGEAGLDYHYDLSPREAQVRGFRNHIAAARTTGLPLVIHSRDADEDMARILEEESGRGAFPAVLHCFTGGRDLARRAIALGLFISFTGILTFKKSDDLRVIAQSLPADRVLLETDAPYLAPGRYRGKRNEPAYVVETAKTLADTRAVSLEEIARQTTENFFHLFRKVPGRGASADTFTLSAPA